MALPEVDQVLGNVEKFDPGSYNSDDPILVQDIMEVEELASHMVSSFEDKVRAFIQIQNGCNHRCTFCTIPYGRGNSRSVPLGQIREQIEKLMNDGYKEFILTGVDITDYGLDLPGTPTLGQTIKRLLDMLPGMKRLRLSSLDPSEIDEDLWELIATESRLLPHFHLSLQAGDDMILKRMKRRHLRHHIFEFLTRVRTARPDAVIGADIIAGFPTETDQMFENTREIVKQLDLLHIFPFSPHDNTPASKMPQVPKAIIKQRAAILRQEAEICLQRVLNRFVGKEETMLVERIENGIVHGKTDHYLSCQFSKNESVCCVGDIVKIRISGIEKNILTN
jgi:threonylcarbamoyladenosine tRNA methylthiotransferase MtaB